MSANASPLDREKSIEMALGSIEKLYGKGAIMRLGSNEPMIRDVETIPTGSIGIDVLVVDSVAALVPRAEIEGEMGDSHVGLQARLMSQALRKLTGIVAKSRTCVIFINQIRMKIGVMFGNPETTTGGNALKFYSSVRIDIRRIGAIKAGDAVTGNRTRVKVVKNKMAAPFRQHEFDIMFGAGISRMGDVLDKATELNIIDKAGSWYSYQGERIGQGREQSIDFLGRNAGMSHTIESRIRQACDLPPMAGEPPAAKSAPVSGDDAAPKSALPPSGMAQAARRGRPPKQHTNGLASS